LRTAHPRIPGSKVVVCAAAGIVNACHPPANAKLTITAPACCRAADHRFICHLPRIDCGSTARCTSACWTTLRRHHEPLADDPKDIAPDCRCHHATAPYRFTVATTVVRSPARPARKMGDLHRQVSWLTARTPSIPPSRGHLWCRQWHTLDESSPFTVAGAAAAWAGWIADPTRPSPRSLFTRNPIGLRRPTHAHEARPSY
jgi:hypothetical protein